MRLTFLALCEICQKTTQLLVGHSHVCFVPLLHTNSGISDPATPTYLHTCSHFPHQSCDIYIPAYSHSLIARLPVELTPELLAYLPVCELCIWVQTCFSAKPLQKSLDSSWTDCHKIWYRYSWCPVDESWLYSVDTAMLAALWGCALSCCPVNIC